MSDKKKPEEIIARQQRQIATLKAENTLLKKKVLLQANNDKEFFALRDLIALMPGNIFWKDKEGRLLGCNNHLAKILRLTSPEEIIGKHTIDLVGTSLAAEIDKIDKEIMASTEPSSIEESGFNENGEPAVYLSYKIPLRNRSGEVIGLLGTSLDITEHKKMEQELKIAKEKAEALSKAKSQFLAVINHELRTPLTGILGLVNFLKSSDLSETEIKSTIEDLENCSQNLLNLVNDVLDFSRLEAGRYGPIMITPVHLATLINEVLSIISGLAKNKGLELQAQIDHHFTKQILTDTRILRQILINIVNNAVKFTDKGCVSINMRAFEQSNHKAKVEIAIHDTGPGIAPEKLELIFEPFRQLEDTYTRRSSRGGTGLGLAIVKQLSALLHMKINIISHPGKGTIFSLVGEFDTVEHKQYDLKKPADLSPNTIEQKTDCTQADEKKLKILLIEDDKVVQRIHKKMLTDLGCGVDIVSQGYEALRTLNDHDIIFVDIGLPDINGFEVIKLIRQHHDIRKRQLPIIALTGYTGDEEKSASLSAGANEMATKPISQSGLKSILIRYTKQAVTTHSRMD